MRADDFLDGLMVYIGDGYQSRMPLLHALERLDGKFIRDYIEVQTVLDLKLVIKKLIDRHKADSLRISVAEQRVGER